MQRGGCTRAHIQHNESSEGETAVRDEMTHYGSLLATRDGA